MLDRKLLENIEVGDKIVFDDCFLDKHNIVEKEVDEVRVRSGASGDVYEDYMITTDKDEVEYKRVIEVHKKNKNVLLIVTGSISAYQSINLANKLKKMGYDIHTILTDAGNKIASATTFSVITGNKSITDDMWFSADDIAEIPHIKEARWADTIVVCPASADFIAKMAYGFADSIASATVLAFVGMKKEFENKKIFVAPAMNNYMYTNRITQDNIERLKSYGFKIINPVVGTLACGDTAIGHLKPIDEIIEKITKRR